MNPGMKMLLMDNIRKGSDEATLYPRREYDIPEDRRRRDRKGRFVSEYVEDRMPERMRDEYDKRSVPVRTDNYRSYTPARSEMYTDYEEERQPIGFRSNMRSDYRSEMTHDEHAERGQRSYGMAKGSEDSFDKATAEQWTHGMKNADGSSGEHWSMDQVKQVMAQKGIQEDPYEFYAVINAVYSDMCKVAKKFGVDRLDFYVDSAKAWLDDEDAVPEKAMAYFQHVVKHK